MYGGREGGTHARTHARTYVCTYVCIRTYVCKKGYVQIYHNYGQFYWHLCPVTIADINMYFHSLIKHIYNLNIFLRFRSASSPCSALECNRILVPSCTPQ